MKGFIEMMGLVPTRLQKYYGKFVKIIMLRSRFLWSIFSRDLWEGHGFGVDIWACGVILYVMLVGKVPFDEGRGTEKYK